MKLPVAQDSDFTVELRVHVPAAMSDELGRACSELGLSRAALVRLVLRDWLRTKAA